jgi:hypothetical protein
VNENLEIIFTKMTKLVIFGVMLVLKLIGSESMDDYVDAKCEYLYGGEICDCHFSREVSNIYFPYQHFFIQHS